MKLINQTGDNQTSQRISSSTVCPICGEVRFSPAWQSVSNTSGIQKEYCIVSCDNCGLLVTSPTPKTSQLDRVYSTGVYSQSGGRLHKVIERVLTSLIQNRLRTIVRITPKKSLLDVGCGKGRFVSTAAKGGWNAYGYDYNKSQAKTAAERYGIVVFSGNTIRQSMEERKFDVITCWHVLEHVDTPKNLLNQMYSALNLDGLLVVEVPNAKSWQARIGKGLWFQADVPRHIHHFTLDNMIELLEIENFEIIKTSTWSLELGPFGMLQTILNKTGFAPNLLFRWLKRVETDSFLRNSLCLLAATFLVVPAILLELCAVAAGAGGVQTVYAIKQVE